MGGRLRRPLRRRHAGGRRARRRALRPQGPPRRPAAGQVARRAPRLRAASTTPPAASSRPPSRRSRRRPPPPSSPASAASRSRSASPTARGPAPGRRAPRAPRRRPFMVDANQQWDRARARRMCRELEQFDLVWIEEPLDAWDPVGHADLSQTFDTPIATGEMLTSRGRAHGLVDAGYRGIVQPDAPRIGGITPFLASPPWPSHAGLRPRAALRDGDPPPPRGDVPHRAVGRALRVAQPALQRAHRHPRRPDSCRTVRASASRSAIRPGPGPRRRWSSAANPSDLSDSQLATAR